MRLDHWNRCKSHRTSDDVIVLNFDNGHGECYVEERVNVGVGHLMVPG